MGTFEPVHGDIWTAFGLTLMAGLATGVGSVIAFFAPRTDFRFLGVAMGFSAGVMLYVSFTEILAKADAAMTAAHGAPTGAWLTLAAFLGGIGLIAGIDALIPKADNPHQPRTAVELHDVRTGGHDADPMAAPGRDERAANPVPPGRALLRTGLFAALAIGIHNFPEGLATFVAALEDPRLGLALAVAVALHNIPEGISVSVPIYYATGSRGRAFAWSCLSGLAEPIGALAGFALLKVVAPEQITGLLFASVAGVMVYISLDELLPAARQYGTEHLALGGIVAGMAVMGVSLVLMR
jgi:ZIP family zinc transporter